MITKSQTGVRVSVDSRTKVNFELGNGGIKTEVVEVEAERKGIDVEQSGRIIENHNYQEFRYPRHHKHCGKNSRRCSGRKRRSINIRGGRTNENIIIVDGVETTNPLDGSSRAFHSE